MKTFSCVLAGLLAATLGLSVAVAQNTPPAGGGGAGGAGGGRGAAGGAGGGGLTRLMNPAGQNPYDEMVKTITTLTDDQKKQLKTKTDAMQQALTDQQTAMRDEMMQAFRGGMQGGDALSTIATQVLKLQTDRAALTAKSEMDVESVLTADQKAEWEGHKLSQQVDARLPAAQLTDDQKTKLAAAVKDTAKLLAAVTDVKDKAPLIGKFWKKLVAEVLTDEQISKLMAPPAGLGGVLGMLGMGGGGAGGAGGLGGMGGAGGGRGGRGGAGGANAPAN